MNCFSTRVRATFCTLAAFVITWLAGQIASASTFVRMDYNLYLNANFYGTVFVELFDDKPVTRDNFLLYVDGGHYDESIMHRLSRNFVLQGGGFYQDFVDEPALNSVSLNPNVRVDLDGNLATSNPTIVNEYSSPPIRSNIAGTVAMARVGGQVNSATNQFFFNLSNSNSFLDTVDGGFTVFARVVGNGMTLLNTYNSSLGIANLNPDTDDNGTRDGGPFGLSSTDGVPYTGGTLLRLEQTNRSDYFSSTSTTNVSASNLTFTNSLSASKPEPPSLARARSSLAPGKTLSASHSANITRPLEVSGTFSPGLAVGAVSLQSYTQLAGGTTRAFRLAGKPLARSTIRSTLPATAVLAGTLRVTGWDDFHSVRRRHVHDFECRFDYRRLQFGDISHVAGRAGLGSAGYGHEYQAGRAARLQREWVGRRR